MASFDGFRKSGTFTVTPGLEVQGDLILKYDATTLDLYAKDFFSTHDLPGGCILSSLHDRTKVSLIECVTTQGPGWGSRGGEQYYYSSLFPHFVLFGDEHITATDKKITSVSLYVQDAVSLFYDFDVFGKVIGAKRHISNLIASKDKDGREIAVGDYPMIFYFTGKYEIFRAETVLGTISANHQLSSGSPGPGGIKVENKIHLNIEFKERATVKDAVDAVYTLLQFLEIMAGRRQTMLRLEFMVRGAEDRLYPLDVYCSMSLPRGDDASVRGLHPADLPIQAACEPQYFAKVLTAWLARDQEWRSARFRFSSALALQRSFTIDRLVGAANMFDILPASAFPSVAPLTKDIEDAKAKGRTLFRSLPPTPERDSILNALGRLGKASLKMKVRARTKLIFDRLPTRFPKLELVVDEAVDCRNFFVHGSKAKMDYNENFDQVSFFTETLEFIFAASDLIECGWDIEGWAKQASLISHPFARFHMNYQSCLEKLKRALAAVKPAAQLSVEFVFAGVVPSSE